MVGAAPECNAILKVMQWSLGSYNPVTRWINDAKVASINTLEVCGLCIVIPVNTKKNCKQREMTTRGHGPLQRLEMLPWLKPKVE